MGGPTDPLSKLGPGSRPTIIQRRNPFEAFDKLISDSEPNVGSDKFAEVSAIASITQPV